MKKLHIIAVVSLVLVLLVTAWSPATAVAANTTTLLSISNKTGMPVMLTLTGPKNYTITLVPGNMTKDIPSGVYKYTYKACGVEKKGQIKAAGARTKLNIAPCKTSVILIVNRTDQTIQVTLTGPFTYRYTVPAESTLPVKVIRGVYRGTGNVCGKNLSRECQALMARYVWIFYPCR